MRCAAWLSGNSRVVHISIAGVHIRQLSLISTQLNIMVPDLASRKPVHKVTREDFATFPIWEWAIDEEGLVDRDESYVRPTSHSSIPTDSFAQFIVVADAKLRDGTTLPAAIEVTVNGKAKSFEPMSVLLLDRHLEFVGMETTRLLSRYTKVVDNYPVRWQLRVPVKGEAKLRNAKVRRSLSFRLLSLIWRLKFGKAVA
jgi:hypothetical protein